MIDAYDIERYARLITSEIDREKASLLDRQMMKLLPAWLEEHGYVKQADGSWLREGNWDADGFLHWPRELRP